MNDIRKTIGWADLSWNPIKGICPVGCWYCYAKNIYKRFGIDPTPRLADRHELVAPMLVTGKDKKRIFVCSTFDLFCKDADPFRDHVFEIIEHAAGGRPDLTFIILTKLPERIDRPMPPNVWLGVSMTSPEDFVRWEELQKHPASVHFISAEPLLEPFAIKAVLPDWLIVGRLSGHGKKLDPSRDSLEYIYADCKKNKVPLFMKSNLSKIWPGKLIQEWPEV